MNDKTAKFDAQRLFEIMSKVGIAPLTMSTLAETAMEKDQVEKAPRRFYLNNFPIYRRKRHDEDHKDYQWEYRIFQDSPHSHIVMIPSWNQDVNHHAEIIVHFLKEALKQPITITTI